MILWTTWQECKDFISQSSIFYNLRTTDPVILNHNISSDISIYNISSSLNFKVYPWQNIPYSPSSQLNKMDKTGFSVFWLTRPLTPVSVAFCYLILPVDTGLFQCFTLWQGYTMLHRYLERILLKKNVLLSRISSLCRAGTDDLDIIYFISLLPSQTAF